MNFTINGEYYEHIICKSGINQFDDTGDVINKLLFEINNNPFGSLLREFINDIDNLSIRNDADELSDDDFDMIYIEFETERILNGYWNNYCNI